MTLANVHLKDIVEGVYVDKDNTLNKAEIEMVLRKGLALMGDHLANMDKLYLIGFMNFEPKDYKAKNSKHPQNGEDMVIPAYRGVSSKPSEGLKAKLEAGYKRDH
jgi:nucleoid DNA-binding protein